MFPGCPPARNTIGDDKAGSFTYSSSKSFLNTFAASGPLFLARLLLPVPFTFLFISLPSSLFCSSSFFHLPVVSFALPSADSQDLSLTSWPTFFPSVFPLLQGYCVSLLCFSALPYCLSISFLLCKKKKWKSISCNPLLYFSNKNPTREPSHIVFVFHKTMKMHWQKERVPDSGVLHSALPVLH